MSEAERETTELDQLPKAARRVARLLADRGYPWQVRLLPDSARSAAEAAAALGCAVDEIAKSIVFAGVDADETDTAVVVVVSGSTRVNEARVAEIVGPIGRANADFVKATTGYSIGGVSPFGLASTARLLVDRSLDGLAQCFCAAGHPHAVVQTTFDLLLAESADPPVDVT